MSDLPDRWDCPGCNTVVVYKGYGRRGKYCTRECILAHKKLLRREAVTALRLEKAALKPFKSGNLYCKQCGNPLPPYGKIFCSAKCNHQSRYELKHRDRVPPKCEAEKTARNLEEAGTCSLCENTLARSGWYKVEPHPMIPKGVELCAHHRRSFGAFVGHNKYGGMDVDEVFTAYLVKLVFPNAGGQRYMVMIREAFHARYNGD